jgi:hypothetical protein
MSIARSARRWWPCAAALSTVLFATACGYEPPTAPTTANLTGTWASTDGRVRWTLVQSGTTVTGEETQLPSGRRFPFTGSLEGGQFTYDVVTGEQIVEFVPGTPLRVSEGWSLFADLESVRRMKGHISNFGIPGRYPRAWYYLTMVKVDHAR